jgi:hypothetical protein
MENIEVLQRVVEERNVLDTVHGRKEGRKANILCGNWLLKQAINGKMEGRIKVEVKRGTRRRQLLDDIKENKGYCKLKEDTLYCTLRSDVIGKG